MSNQPRVAVLIDADNIPASLCGEVLEKCEKLGHVIIKRAYGNFTCGSARAWLPHLPKHSITARLNLSVCNSATGKNAADISLVVDAMKLSFGDKADIFFIVSADSDFTRLAEYIREDNKIVHAIGLAGKLTSSFKASCHTFYELTIPGQSTLKKAEELNATSDKPYLAAYHIFQKAYIEFGKPNDWFTNKEFGPSLQNLIRQSTKQTAGIKTMKQVIALVKSTGLIETKCDKSNNAAIKVLKRK